MKWSNRRVLVTGAGGFIGSHLAERLVQEGAHVRAMVRYNSMNSAGYLDSIEPAVRGRIEVIHGDIRDARFVAASIEGSAVVFHLAALITIPYSYVAPGSYVETNVTGTLNVLEALRVSRDTRLVHTSTSEVYGSAPYAPIDEKHQLQAQSPYSASKIAADKLVESYVSSFGVRAMTLRPFNTYGPRQTPRAILPSLLMQALNGERIRVGSLDPVRDLTYVTDTVEGFLLAADAEGLDGEAVNLGVGTGFSVAELIDKVAAAVGRKLSVEVEQARVRPEASEVRKLISDNSMAREKLGWSPRISLDEGIALMLPWFREHRGNYDPSVYNV